MNDEIVRLREERDALRCLLTQALPYIESTCFVPDWAKDKRNHIRDTRELRSRIEFFLNASSGLEPVV